MAMLENIKYIREASICVILVLLIVLAIPSPAAAEVEKSVTAQVTVSTFINFTIIDYGKAGLKFGNLIPGSKNNPEVAQGEKGAVLLQLGSDSNIDCIISTKADDFISGSDKLPVSNVTWNISKDTSGVIVMKDSYSVIKTLKPGDSQDVWHWLNVPTGQAGGIYSASFYYQAEKVKV